MNWLSRWKGRSIEALRRVIMSSHRAGTIRSLAKQNSLYTDMFAWSDWNTWEFFESFSVSMSKNSCLLVKIKNMFGCRYRILKKNIIFVNTDRMNRWIVQRPFKQIIYFTWIVYELRFLIPFHKFTCSQTHYKLETR